MRDKPHSPVSTCSVTSNSADGLASQLPIFTTVPNLPEHIQTLGFPVVHKQPDGLCLVFEDGKLGLKDFSEPRTGAVIVDFSADALQYRAKNSSIKNEAIAKAMGLKGNTVLSIVDATAGLGRDAFMLMSLGAKLTLLERSPVVAALLTDGIHRGSLSNSLAADFALRFRFQPGHAGELLSHWQGEAPDAIYLDPMFPHKKKSALVKKEMRLFQKLLGSDEDADLLLAPALSLAKKTSRSKKA